jgi:hypothetical protein
MRSPVNVRLVCGRRDCRRHVGTAQAHGDRIAYRVPDRPSATPVRLVDVPPTFHRGGSMADITAAIAADRDWEGTPDHRTVTFPAHPRCRARREVRQDRLDALVMAAVAYGEPSVTLPG